MGHDREPGPVVVTLDLQGATSETTVGVPGSGTVWGVVDVQGERAWGDLQVHDEAPQWG